MILRPVGGGTGFERFERSLCVIAARKIVTHRGHATTAASHEEILGIPSTDEAGQILSANKTVKKLPATTWPNDSQSSLENCKKQSSRSTIGSQCGCTQWPGCFELEMEYFHSKAHEQSCAGGLE